MTKNSLRWIVLLLTVAILFPAAVFAQPLVVQPIFIMDGKGNRLGIAHAATATLASGTTAKSKLHIPRKQRISFNHVMTDGGGFRWDIQHYGNVGQGTNYAYSSGLYCQVNGSNISSNGVGWRNKAGDEIEIGPYNRNNLRCYRRIKVYKDLPLARWLDIFENPTRQDITISIRIYSHMNWGIGQTITTSKGNTFGPKDWAFITVPQGGNNVPRLLHVVCGKKSKLRPTVTIRGNQIYVNWSLTVPAGKTAVLCYFESQNQSIDAHHKLLKEFKPYKLLRDLSPSVRKLIVNFSTYIGLESVELERSESFDMILLRNGDLLQGTIANASFEIESFAGRLKLPAGQVIGMACRRTSSSQPGPGDDGQMLTVLKDGQIVVGRPVGTGSKPVPHTVDTGLKPVPRILLKMTGGNELRVPFSDIRQWSYRISKDRPEEIAFAGPFVVLRTGDRLAFDTSGIKLQLLTRHGLVDLDPTHLLRIRMDNPAGAVHRAEFLNGSRLAGLLHPRQIHAVLRLGPKLDVPRDMIAQFQFAQEPKTDETLTRALLTNGDELFGKIADRKINIRTDYGDVEVSTGNIRAMAFSRTHLGRAVVQLWEGSVLRGQLEQQELSFDVMPGPVVKIYVGQFAGIVRSQILPPDEIVKRAEKLIPLLGSESFNDRESATKELIKLGPGVIPILNKYRKSTDPEIRRRIQDILDKLEAKGGTTGGSPGPVPRGLIIMNGKGWR